MLNKLILKKSSLRERYSTSRALFIHLSKSLVNEPPSMFPSGPLWREMPVPSAYLYTSSRVPSKGDRLQVPLTELPQREILHF